MNVLSYSSKYSGNYSSGNYSTGIYSTRNYSPRNYSFGSYHQGKLSSSDYYPRSYSSYTLGSCENISSRRSPYISTSIISPRIPSVTKNFSNTVESNNSLYEKSCSSKEENQQRVGLNNLGNTCFMNAIFQCLCHTQPLTDYCVRGSYQRDLNYSSPSKGNLIKEFAELVKNLLESKTAISPSKLRMEAQRYASTFQGEREHDAHEFLRYFLQGLHEDINRTKFNYSGQRRYQDSNNSFIGDLFAGQLKSTLKCMNCRNDSVMLDPFWDLSLPIPEGSATSLNQLFNLFSYPEILDGQNAAFCELCRKKSRCSKKIEISKFPKVLVIHLKRFSASSFFRKLNITVDCPLKLNNLSEISSRSFFNSYTLYGVVDHIGTSNSGHYIAKCKNPLTKSWYEFNDARVNKVSDATSSNSYILFYIQD